MLGVCAFCGLPTSITFADLRARRVEGEPIFCDEACRAAGEQLREKIKRVMPPDIERHLCRHRMGTVGGRCLDCGRAVRA